MGRRGGGAGGVGVVFSGGASMSMDRCVSFVRVVFFLVAVSWGRSIRGGGLVCTKKKNTYIDICPRWVAELAISSSHLCPLRTPTLRHAYPVPRRFATRSKNAAHNAKPAARSNLPQLRKGTPSYVPARRLQNLFPLPLHLSSGSIVQLPSRPSQDARDLLDLFPSKRPIPIIDGVADTREVSGLVAGPGLRGEDDVLVLCAVGELCVV